MLTLEKNAWLNKDRKNIASRTEEVQLEESEDHTPLSGVDSRIVDRRSNFSYQFSAVFKLFSYLSVFYMLCHMDILQLPFSCCKSPGFSATVLIQEIWPKLKNENVLLYKRKGIMISKTVLQLQQTQPWLRCHLEISDNLCVSSVTLAQLRISHYEGCHHFIFSLFLI